MMIKHITAIFAAIALIVQANAAVGDQIIVACEMDDINAPSNVPDKTNKQVIKNNLAAIWRGGADKLTYFTRGIQWRLVANPARKFVIMVFDPQQFAREVTAADVAAINAKLTGQCGVRICPNRGAIHYFLDSGLEYLPAEAPQTLLRPPGDPFAAPLRAPCDYPFSRPSFYLLNYPFQH